MCATSEIPQATKRPSEACAPATWPYAAGCSTPQTWLTLTPTFSNTSPRIRRDSPPPCSRLPSGLVQLRASNRLTGSNASNAAHSRACRSRKQAVAGAAKSLAPLMHVIHQARDRIGVGVGPDAVSEVEDVSRRGAGFIEHRIDVPVQLGRRSKQGRRIEIALHGLAGPEHAAYLRQTRPPIDPDHVHIKLRHGRHESRALVYVVDEGHAGAA